MRAWTPHLFGDLLRRLGRCFVSLSSHPRSDSQIWQLGELGDKRFADAVSQVLALARVVPCYVKRQNGRRPYAVSVGGLLLETHTE